MISPSFGLFFGPLTFNADAPPPPKWYVIAFKGKDGVGKLGGISVKGEDSEEVEVPKELVRAIQRLLRERPELGYRNVDQFVTEAITRFLDKH